jgi:FHS family glucose/mannose:H+ symporter-like MFS transporter
MKHKIEITLIYLTGLMQGLVLVTVPAASSVFIDPRSFSFSSSQYGALFVPQVIMSILAALLAPKISRRLGSKVVYQAGVVFNCLAASLVALSQLFVGHPAAYVCLLLSTSAVGAAFGTTLPMINVYAQRFFPKNTAGALTGLHSLLGLGTAMAPVLVIVFVKHLGWWLLPLLALVVMTGIFLTSLFLPLLGKEEKALAAKQGPGASFGYIFWLFIMIIFLYGYCETLFGNWVIIYLTHEKSISAVEASYALSVFWVMVTLGRILTSLLSAWIAPRWIYLFLPFLILAALWGVSIVHSAMMGVVLFGLAGLGCSSFFPLSFSFAQGRFASDAQKVSGSLMASYMVGYGFASYGIGRMVEAGGFSLEALYRVSVFAALGIMFFSFFLFVKKIL